MEKVKKTVQIIANGRELMSRKKRGKKKNIKRGIGKKVPKIKLKKKKKLTSSKAKDQTKGNGLFQPFFKAIENFKKKQKVESFQQMKFGGKKRERQIKEEQQKLKEDEKKLEMNNRHVKK